MRVQTTRFGILNIAKKDIITFISPILGFPNDIRYVLLKEGQNGLFHWLQSLDNPELAFVVTNPLVFAPDYRIRIHKDLLSDLELEDLRKGEVLALVSIRKDPMRITMNLQAPILLNKEKMKAKQLVLNPEEYSLRYEILQVKRQEQVEA